MFISWINESIDGVILRFTHSYFLCENNPKATFEYIFSPKAKCITQVLNQVGMLYISYFNELHNLTHQEISLLCQRQLFHLILSQVKKSVLWFLNEFSLISPECSQIWQDGRDKYDKEKNATMNFYKIIMNSVNCSVLDSIGKEPCNAT